MKRLISLTLALLLLFACSGCIGRAASLPDEEARPAQTHAPIPPEAEDAQPEEPHPDPTDQAQTPENPENSQPPENPEAPEDSENPEAPEEPFVRVIDPSKPMVALTFDDGPHPTYSDAILDILEANHAVATFFEVGVNVANCPEVVLREQELGCEIGSHSYSHKNLGKMKKSSILRDLAAADDAFIAAGVEAPTLVRPPYGSVNRALKYETGRTMVTWSVDTEDWRSRDAEKIIASVQGVPDLDGHVVLLHSIYQSTVDAAEVLVPWLQEQGYQLVTVTELMAYYYGELPQPDHFYGYTYFTTHGRTDTPAALPTPDTPLALPAAEQEETAPAA